MRTLNIGPRDEVIVPVLTFAATANAPLFVSAKPVFADIDEKTFNISAKEIEEKITKRTKAIIVVHYGGQPCNMKEIMKIGEDHNINVVEDCAHALGAVYQGKKTGSFGTVGCFSFYPTKMITTLEAREKEITWYYDVVDLGYNYRLNEIQAALGISQLKRTDTINDKRIKAARYYTKKLKDIEGIITPYEAEDRTHVYHLYVIRVLKEKFGIDRDELFKRLATRGIGTSVHYTPLHLLTFYREKLGYKNQSFPVAERLYEEILSLPIFPTISRAQTNYTVQEIAKNKK